MKLNKLASAISRGVWLMEPRTAHGLVPLALRFLHQEGGPAPAPPLEMPVAHHNGQITETTIEDNIWSGVQPGSVAVIPVSGALMKDDYCGSPGTDTLSAWVKQAGQSGRVEAIVLKINSGGGSVAGTGEFAEVIKQSSIPVLAYCDGLMASAAYWIGSACSEIYASHQTVEVGSIGTMISFMDDSEALQKQGYKEHVINADTSPDKNQDYFAALAGSYSRIKVNILNPTNDIFMNAVKANRAGKLKLTNVKTDGVLCQEPLTGKVYLAQTAIGNGLIDGIATLDAVIDRALQLAQSPNQNNNNMNVKSKERAAGNQSVLDKLVRFVSGLKAEESGKPAPGEKPEDEDEETDPRKKLKPTKSKPAPEDVEEEEDDTEPTEDDLQDENEALKQEIERLKTLIGKQSELLTEASTALEASNRQLRKNKEELSNDIRSSFVPENSRRSNKATVEAAIPGFLQPTQGSLAANAVKAAVAGLK
ncbi:S49 family peptidase [Mucilaginibacter sp. CSA2-8R]|uniref:S49 family peptidase n=1 Tax=Mucilaginibacter sp. CSA2-8R TaxID=3141542 RepID=UPI00315CE983